MLSRIGKEHCVPLPECLTELVYIELSPDEFRAIAKEHGKDPATIERALRPVVDPQGRELPTGIILAHYRITLKR